MRHQIISANAGHLDLTHRQTLAELDDAGVGDEVCFSRAREKIDIETGGDSKLNPAKGRSILSKLLTDLVCKYPPRDSPAQNNVFYYEVVLITY